MSLLEVFRHKQKKSNSASIARERLQIIVAHERTGQHTPDYLPAMKQDILAVVRKYVNVEQEHISFSFESQQEVSILELNVTLPEEQNHDNSVPA